MLKRTLFITLSLAAPALATETKFFEHSTRPDFDAGTLDAIVATNFGELKLAHAVEPLLADDGRYASIDAMVETPDGTVYVGTSASGRLIAIRDGKPAEVADFGEAASVSALAVTAGGDVMIGVSGERAEVQVLRKGEAKPARLAQLPEGTQYVWAIGVAADGKLYLGTGPGGQLFEMSADGAQQRAIFDSDEDNLRAVAVHNDTLFVGTDPNGLILKVERATGKAFVVYDAAETEVSALLLDPRGGQIYAATSQLVESEEEPEAEEEDESTGRPIGSELTPIVAEPSPAPEPSEPEDDGTLRAASETPTEIDLDASPATRPDVATGIDVAGPQPTSSGDSDDAEPAADGNAVYRIDPQGFVSEVFREPVMVFALARRDDELFIATGPGGTLYRLDLTSEEHVSLATLRPSLATSVLAAADGRLLIGTGGGSAELSTLSAGLDKSGTFTSAVLDAGQISLFGKLQVRGTVPTGATLTVATRAGNVSDEESPLWSDWSAEVPAARFAEVATPSARYAQYRLTFGGNAAATVDAIEWAYLQPNVAPRIDSITAAAAEPIVDEGSGESAANPQRTIEWAATEPNGDALRFTLSIRNAPGAPWTILAKDLEEVTYDWDTRRVADGRYEIRVEASDALANAHGMGKTASRVSEPVTVDNAPPMIGDVKVERSRGNVSIAVTAADRAGVVSRLEYRVDDAEHWQRAQPSDMLNDSPAEQYVIVLPEAGAATRVVSLRCQDENGNAAYESVTVRPEKPSEQSPTSKPTN